MHKIIRSIKSALSLSSSSVSPSPTNKSMKMIILVRTDLKMTKGKIATQCAHAAVLGYQQMLADRPSDTAHWIRLGQPKIVLQVDTLQLLEQIASNAENLGITSQMVRDAGRTQLVSGTVTAVGLGPDFNERLDKIVKSLRLL